MNEKNTQSRRSWLKDRFLSIKEAAYYNDIDEKILAEIVAENPNLEFIIYLNKTPFINQAKFEEWCGKDKQDIPWWTKYMLTIEESSKYYNIGITTLRTLIRNNPELDFIVNIGRRTLINRKKFEKWLDMMSDL